MDEQKFLVRLQITGPAILEHLITNVGLGKMGVVFSHFQTLLNLAKEKWQKEDGEWINIRLTPAEIRKINLTEKGQIYLEKIDLYIPYWAIQTVEISSSGRNTPPKQRHWATWSRFPGWGNCSYMK